MLIKERLLKLYALAQRGVGGEKENAEKILNRLLLENGMSIEDLERTENTKKDRCFVCKDDAHYTVLTHIIGKVINQTTIVGHHSRRTKNYYFELTDREYITVSMLWDIYGKAFLQQKKELKKKLREEAKNLTIAFVLKYNLLPEKQSTSNGSGKKYDMDEILRIMAGMPDIEIKQELPGRMLEVKK
ncbi:MAG: hypothetical protein PUB86_04080 [Elusimicrobia bacterium]|nr:hypothetical protein [Elusimicrobiota bacterium]